MRSWVKNVIIVERYFKSRRNFFLLRKVALRIFFWEQVVDKMMKFGEGREG